MANIRNLPTWWAGEATVGPAGVDVQTIDTVTGAIALCARFGVTNAATGNQDYTVPFALRVTDVRFVKTTGAGAAGNTVQLQNGTSNMTDAMDTNVAAGAMVRCATLDSTQHTFATGGTLRIVRTKAGGDSSGIVYIDYVRL